MQTKNYIKLFLVLCMCYTVVGIDTSIVRQTFVKNWLQTIGNGSAISVDDIKLYFKQQLWTDHTGNNLSDCRGTDFTGQSSNSVENCLLHQCLSPADLYSFSGLQNASTATEVSTLSMILLHNWQKKTCAENFADDNDQHDSDPVSRSETWGYGILCSSIIVLAALGGFLALPFIHGVNYKRTLIFMVGLAVGTLAGSSLLFLIPEALELTEQELDRDSYLWKCLVVIGAIYIFFIIERLLKIFSHKKEKSRKEKELHKEIHSGRFGTTPSDTKFREPKLTSLQKISESSTSSLNNLTDFQDVSTISGSVSENDLTKDGEAKDLKHVAPVAWMIIFGDAVHNFVDGVSIGAAFTESILGGVSVSVAIFCEELPHELGDFAVLLHAGMSRKRAVLFNFLSACTIYIGMIIGIFLGENVEAHTWVFAFAGGMFLYISLADMMPEMCAAGELEENQRLVGTWVIFILQNLGILVGFGVILLLAIYGGNLESAIKGEK
ncbi:metal cation symporter ZIP14-like isoform X1 [Ruditapes philippinarum]|uniref:metal cation symporter ZIP14-like isoform X1 n=1 Tax=Ruditapes philippinarum TaxID=129788 RepID=UPI00295B737E|nr:metal cation symporter ZIP14-like isoform X1 [Ruditapes philippinarum]